MSCPSKYGENAFRHVCLTYSSIQHFSASIFHAWKQNVAMSNLVRLANTAAHARFVWECKFLFDFPSFSKAKQLQDIVTNAYAGFSKTFRDNAGSFCNLKSVSISTESGRRNVDMRSLAALASLPSLEKVILLNIQFGATYELNRLLNLREFSICNPGPDNNPHHSTKSLNIPATEKLEKLTLSTNFVALKDQGCANRLKSLSFSLCTNGVQDLYLLLGIVQISRIPSL